MWNKSSIDSEQRRILERSVSSLIWGLPLLQHVVTVVGYPDGGDTISVTSGVVSHIEILSYVHGATELLGLQVVRVN